MMRLSAVIVFVCLILGVFSFGHAQQPLMSNELINHASEYDGTLITYRGEIIGDIMVRSDFAWLNVNDSENALGCWVGASLISGLTYSGGFKFKGDVVEVTGIFHRRCMQHGGDLDIHVETLRKVSPGRVLNERLNTDKRFMVLVLTGVLCLVLMLMFYKKKPQAK